jgi:pyrroline-5-carboxylate reductase
MSELMKHLKVGFLGAGNMTSALIKRLIETKAMGPSQIFVSSRTQGKVIKLSEQFGVNISPTNENLVDGVDIVVIAVKPQDFNEAVESIASIFQPSQVVISLAAGLELSQLRKIIPQVRWARVMPNTPSKLGRGVIGYCTAKKEDEALQSLVSDFLAPFGHVVSVEEGDSFDTLLVASACGTGFILELMSYWIDWIEERGFTPEEARQITVNTFLGTAILAHESYKTSIDNLISDVASKKGVTSAGLDSMRELELERGLRISFEKSWIRNHEISRGFKSK